MTSENKNELETSPQVDDGKKRLTLTLSKKAVSPTDKVPEEKKEGEVPHNRSKVFIVPPTTRPAFFDRDRRPMTDDERKARFNTLRSSTRATSNAQPRLNRSNEPSKERQDSLATFNKRQSFSKKKKTEFGTTTNSKNSRFNSDENSHKLRIGMGVVQTFSSDFDAEADMGWRKTRGKKDNGLIIKTSSVIKIVDIYDDMEVPALAVSMSVSVRDLSRKLKSMGVNPNAPLDIDAAELVVTEFGHTPKRIKIVNADDDPVADFEGVEVKRPPIVTVVGHVDHGKTSLLDAIRKSHVATGEAGGITQHIGAYQVTANNQVITFLDTPGHETFTSMRARGVQLTDIAILVVAADDGIQEQTIEAIKHVKAAGVAVIVAVTKVDKVDANPDKVLEMLLNYDIVAEKYSGDVQAVLVSALKGDGIQALLDAILLQAEMLNLKTRETGHGIGIVLETSVQKGFGNVANMIVQKGVVKVGDNFVVGKTYGRIRCLIDCEKTHLKSALPSTPVSVIGLDGICAPGDRLVIVPNENIAREKAQARIDQDKAVEIKPKTLEELYGVVEQGKTLNVLVKADTAGSVEALKQGILKIKNDEVTVKIVYDGTGLITESDVIFADAAKAIIISFHNKIVPSNVAQVASAKFVHIISEMIIYKILEDLQTFIDNMKKPVITEHVLGKASIIKLFSFSRGTVAGCKVIDGKIVRGMKIKVMRGAEMIASGDIRSLQRETQDVKEAIHGQECGLMLNDFHKYEINDILVCYEEISNK